MADNFASVVINNLDQFNFIAGDTQSLTFEVYDSNGSEVDISTSTCTVVFSPYGQFNYAAITISGSITGSSTHIFDATLNGSATRLLSGKYTMQPVIVDFNGDEFRPAQGVVLISGRNATV